MVPLAPASRRSGSGPRPPTCSSSSSTASSRSARRPWSRAAAASRPWCWRSPSASTRSADPDRRARAPARVGRAHPPDARAARRRRVRRGPGRPAGADVARRPQHALVRRVRDRRPHRDRPGAGRRPAGGHRPAGPLPDGPAAARQARAALHDPRRRHRPPRRRRRGRAVAAVPAGVRVRGRSTSTRAPRSSPGREPCSATWRRPRWCWAPIPARCPTASCTSRSARRSPTRSGPPCCWRSPTRPRCARPCRRCPTSAGPSTSAARWRPRPARSPPCCGPSGRRSRTCVAETPDGGALTRMTFRRPAPVRPGAGRAGPAHRHAGAPRQPRPGASPASRCRWTRRP